ncbi:hypothetical protein [Falsiroseomonas sp. CW058]|uniref:hypothetical protein n=1 Tax=Falsiroseomonas sp. CW058 TaxID=3388664 RepID=UPI003D3226D4
MPTARRRLLACLPVALLPGPAAAFRQEEAEAVVARDYRGACPGPGLQGAAPPVPVDPALPSLPAGSAAVRCPFCGCAVTGAADHGEAPRPARDG